MIPFFTKTDKSSDTLQKTVIETLDEFDTALPHRNPDYLSAKEKIQNCRQELEQDNLQASLISRRLHELVREIGAMLYVEKLVFTPKQMKIWERLKGLQNPCQQVSWGY